MFTNIMNVLSYISHHYLIVLLIGYVLLELTRGFLFHASEHEILDASRLKMIVVYSMLALTGILIMLAYGNAESGVRKSLIFGLGIYMTGHLFAYTYIGIRIIRRP
jgi:hypothetical protein